MNLIIIIILLFRIILFLIIVITVLIIIIISIVSTCLTYDLHFLHLTEVFYECIKFLKENGKEKIIIHLKKGYTNFSDSTLSFKMKEEIVDKNPNYFNNGKDIPTLEQAQNKIVILTRFDIS
ncbi:hypothetical protein H8356DRAFT_934882 [Neocallimastix lanati (nom. inval.)]|nr:hypothetical protein H8356DRAFT_946860 [Neocallimastix sp. JGI-2020a]KAG4100495.1 hypothetical protein H8356DRAFT_934882 [Neocallimastix sp. JGI-2020a]